MPRIACAESESSGAALLRPATPRPAAAATVMRTGHGPGQPEAPPASGPRPASWGRPTLHRPRRPSYRALPVRHGLMAQAALAPSSHGMVRESPVAGRADNRHVQRSLSLSLPVGGSELGGIEHSHGRGRFAPSKRQQPPGGGAGRSPDGLGGSWQPSRRHGFTAWTAEIDERLRLRLAATNATGVGRNYWAVVGRARPAGPRADSRHRSGIGPGPGRASLADGHGHAVLDGAVAASPRNDPRPGETRVLHSQRESLSLP